MSNYTLSLDAEQDLKEIARYTLKKWGKDKLTEYKEGLEGNFKAISDKIYHKDFSERFPDLFVIKHRHHFIFYFFNTSEKPVIIGVIHEQLDIINRLNDRLT